MKKKGIFAKGVVLTACGFALLMLQGNLAQADSTTATPNAQATATLVSKSAPATNNNVQPNQQAASTTQQLAHQNVNQAWLDSTTYQNGQVAVSGWHVATAADTMPNHYLILLSDGHEVGRQKVTNTARPDVARVYPSVNNATNSGWHANFTVTPAMLNENLQLVSRYTSSNDGNSDYVDYWFNPWRIPASQDNYANLDAVQLNDGHLRVSGWNANDYYIAAPNHFMIIFDRTANSQVASTKITNVARPDVARVYSQIHTAGQSGISVDFGKLSLNPTHQYALVSRYSTSSTGNGGNGQYQDNWMNLGDLNHSAFYFDSFQTVGNHLHVIGWMASNWQMTRPYAYLIVLNNGREVGRTRLNLIARPDVGRAYSNSYQSGQSGFSVDLPASLSQLNGNLNLILRFTDDPAGNGNYFDQSKQYQTNAGWLDQFQVSGNTIYVSGWHASVDAANKPVHLLIVVGPSGTELYRTQLTDNNTGRTRNDVANSYPWISNANQSGFAGAIPVNLATNHANIRIISRYATSVADDNNPDDYVDYYFDPHYVNVPSSDHWVSTGNGEYYVYNGQNLTGKHLVSGFEYTFDQSGREVGFAQRLIDWFRSRKGRLTFSMTGSRTGADGTADCSGSVSEALREAGATNTGLIYDTETIGPYLEQNGYYVASSGWQFQPVQYGDLVIWGIPGHSANGAGHMVLVSSHGSNPSCISTQWFVTHGAPGTAVYEDSYYRCWLLHGRMYSTVYRMVDPGRA